MADYESHSYDVIIIGAVEPACGQPLRRRVAA